MSVTTGITEFLSALHSQRSRVWVSIRSTLFRGDAWANRIQGFLALCDQGVISLTNFATGVIIGRVCGKAELGVYALAWTLMTLATEFSATLTTTPYTVFGPQLTFDERRKYLGSILVHQFLLSVLFGLAMVAGAVLASRRGWLSHSLTSVVATTACVIVFIGLREFARRVSFAELKVGSALTVDLIACLIQTGGLLVLLHFGGLTASRIYALIGISSALVGGCWLTLRWGAFHVDVELWMRDINRNWRFAKWVLGSTLLWMLASYTYPWLLAAFHGTSVTGTWAACSTIVALGNPVILGLGNYVGPKIHTEYAISGIPALQRSVYRSSLLFTMLVLPIVLVLAGGGERIMTGIYGKAFAGNAGVIILLALNILISALNFPYTRGLFSLECAKVDTLINVVAVALLFAMGIAAVKSYGVLGAAAALLMSNGITTVIRIGVFSREIRRDRTTIPTPFRATAEST